MTTLASAPAPSIDEDAVYPRDEEHRYRIYVRKGDEIEILAVAGSPAALGVAIVQLDEDERDRGRRLVDLGVLGVLDAVEGRWIILPWHRPTPPPLFALPDEDEGVGDLDAELDGVGFDPFGGGSHAA